MEGELSHVVPDGLITRIMNHSLMHTHSHTHTHTHTLSFSLFLFLPPSHTHTHAHIYTQTHLSHEHIKQKTKEKILQWERQEESFFLDTCLSSWLKMVETFSTGLIAICSLWMSEPKSTPKMQSRMIGWTQPRNSQNSARATLSLYMQISQIKVDFFIECFAAII